MRKTIFVLSIIMAAVHIESARHHKRHRPHSDDNEVTTGTSVTVDESSWPQPNTIGNFPVPSAFVDNHSGGPGGSDNPDEPPAEKHHSRKSHRAHKH